MVIAKIADLDCFHHTRTNTHTQCKLCEMINILISFFVVISIQGILTSKQHIIYFLFSSVQPLSRIRLFATPGIAARQASLSITNSRSSLRLASIESVMPSSHLILCRPLLLLPPIPPSIRVFSSLHEVAKVLEFQL